MVAQSLAHSARSSLYPKRSRPPESAVRACVSSRIERCLANHLSPITAGSVLVWVCRKLGVQPDALDKLQENVLMTVVDQSLTLYLAVPEKQKALSDVRNALRARSHPPEQASTVTVVLRTEADLTLARATALRVALGAALAKPDAVRVSTVVSELARNILQYAGTGQIEIRALVSPRLAVEVVASDQGPGIPNIHQILAGKYRSRTGMGLGLVGSRRLVDEFEVTTEVGKGTTVIAKKYA